MTYGQVLFELGIKKESLQKAQDMLHENEELLSALENPTITKKEKENVVEKLFSDDIKSFLKVVCDNDDIACFDEAVEYYDELKRKTDKIIKAEFDYVTMPKDEQLERIKQYLMKQYQADKVELTLKEEKDLIGGFVLKVGDHVYDNSLSKNVEKFGAADRCRVHAGDAFEFLARTKETFDLVFIDPPYDANLQEKALVAALPRLSEAGLLYVETPNAYLPEEKLASLGLVRLRGSRAGVVHYQLLTRIDSPLATLAKPLKEEA